MPRTITERCLGCGTAALFCPRGSVGLGTAPPSPTPAYCSAFLQSIASTCPHEYQYHLPLNHNPCPAKLSVSFCPRTELLAPSRPSIYLCSQRLRLPGSLPSPRLQGVSPGRWGPSNQLLLSRWDPLVVWADDLGAPRAGPCLQSGCSIPDESEFRTSDPGTGSLWSAMSVRAKSLQSCPTLWDPMDCSPPGSSVHGIFQTRIQEWVAISFYRGSSQPRDPTRVSCAGRQVLHH